MLGLDDTDFMLLGVLRTFGRRGYVTSDSILQRAYPHLAPSVSPHYNPSRYNQVLADIEKRLDMLATFGLAEADDLDLDVGTFRCYRIVENGGPGATSFASVEQTEPIPDAVLNARPPACEADVIAV